MRRSDETPNAEMQLELLLRRLPEEDRDTSTASDGDVSRELLELRDLALRLRAARQFLPASASVGFVHSQEAIAARHQLRGDSANLRRAGWLAVAAAVLVGTFGLAAIAISAGASPSSTWYEARLVMENVEVVLAPSALARAELLVENSHRRLAEIEAMASTGNAGGLRRAADALDADAGWLHAVLKTLPEPQRRQLIRGLGKV